MTTETAETLDRLHACEAGLEVHRGYLKAMEYALRVTFITHQDPDALLSTWTKLLPAIARSHERDGGALFAAAFQQSLTVLTEQMDGGNAASAGSDFVDDTSL
ncbi:MAG: hypothetical protein WBH11_19495 [Stenotrophomonas geniculata]|uniref:hypothetical protein n=1 Tax=Stenotrophomonas maltophilia TaxID=40324 RepID=UPI0008103797|nr:hypothetical protein [Stenotrophomonas maltophilia]OCK48063.1 hypothetical protein BA766_21415 [Stenotrophomonas maltophilia]